MTQIQGEATRDKLNMLVEIAATPQAFRGFGPVKLASVGRFRDGMTSLLAGWNNHGADGRALAIAIEAAAVGA
jgi:hypothetical protein